MSVMYGSLEQEINSPPQGGASKRADQNIVRSQLCLPDRWERRPEKFELGKGKKKSDQNKKNRVWREAGIQWVTQCAGMAEFFVAHREWAKCSPLLVTKGGKGGSESVRILFSLGVSQGSVGVGE